MTITTYNVPSVTFVPYSNVVKQGVVAIAIPLMLLTAGTGGAVTPRSAEELTRWIHTPGIHVENSTSRRVDTRSPAEHVASIRDAFGINMSELANVLGVTRPTVYAWLDGQEPKTDALLQIRRLSRAAKEVLDLNIPRIDKLVRRPIFDGFSLLDKLKRNEDHFAAIAMLKAFAEKELRARRTQKGSGKHKQSIDDIATDYTYNNFNQG